MYSIAAACLWLILANLRALFPSRDHHWRFAYGMMALGLPILVWVYLENGWLVAALVLLAAASVLRWPLVNAWRWVRRMGAGAR